jgi:hypothetical protein
VAPLCLKLSGFDKKKAATFNLTQISVGYRALSPSVAGSKMLALHHIKQSSSTARVLLTVGVS